MNDKLIKVRIDDLPEPGAVLVENEDGTITAMTELELDELKRRQREGAAKLTELDDERR